MAGASWSPVDTERLTLLRPTGEHRGDFVRLQVDPRAIVHHPRPESVTRESASAYVDRSLQHWNEHGFGVWAVVRQSDPQVIGIAGVTHREFHGRSGLNLHYRFDPAFWGRGYAAEAAAAAVDLAVRHMPGLPIVAFTTPSNVGSQRTALAAGLARHPALDVDHGDYSDVYFTLGW